MSAHPLRLAVCTLNVWGHAPGPVNPDRRAALLKTISALASDIFLLQEVSPSILEDIDARLPEYARIPSGEGEGEGGGWTSESQIYFRRSLLTLVAHGVEMDVGMTGAYFARRGLFWARLQVVAPNLSHKSVFVATCHLPWVGGEEECATGLNPRVGCCHLIRRHLNRLINAADSLAVFGGDLNEDFHPPRILTAAPPDDDRGAGTPFLELFASLDMAPPPTHPVRPSDPSEQERPNRTIDWLFHRGAVRVVAAFAKTPRGQNGSDHLPVIGVYELLP